MAEEERKFGGSDNSIFVAKIHWEKPNRRALKHQLKQARSDAKERRGGGEKSVPIRLNLWKSVCYFSSFGFQAPMSTSG